MYLPLSATSVAGVLLIFFFRLRSKDEWSERFKFYIVSVRVFEINLLLESQLMLLTFSSFWEFVTTTSDSCVSSKRTSVSGRLFISINIKKNQQFRQQHVNEKSYLIHYSDLTAEISQWHAPTLEYLQKAPQFLVGGSTLWNKDRINNILSYIYWIHLLPNVWHCFWLEYVWSLSSLPFSPTSVKSEFCTARA